MPIADSAANLNQQGWANEKEFQRPQYTENGA
jgi:hypothetical protein